METINIISMVILAVIFVLSSIMIMRGLKRSKNIPVKEKRKKRRKNGEAKKEIEDFCIEYYAKNGIYPSSYKITKTLNIGGGTSYKVRLEVVEELEAKKHIYTAIQKLFDQDMKPTITRVFKLSENHISKDAVAKYFDEVLEVVEKEKAKVELNSSN